MSAWREEKKTFSLLFSDGNDVDNGDVVAMLAAAAEETMTLLCCCAVVVLCCCVVLNYYDTKTCILTLISSAFGMISGNIDDVKSVMVRE